MTSLRERCETVLHHLSVAYSAKEERDIMVRFAEELIREGREAERARINRGNSAMSLRIIADRASGIYAEELRRIASVIEHAEHVPTPQGDEEVNHG